MRSSSVIPAKITRQWRRIQPPFGWQDRRISSGPRPALSLRTSDGLSSRGNRWGVRFGEIGPFSTHFTRNADILDDQWSVEKPWLSIVTGERIQRSE